MSQECGKRIANGKWERGCPVERIIGPVGKMRVDPRYNVRIEKMVRVRLKRTGSRNAASFRVVVMHQATSRDGKAIEELGYYDPVRREEKLNMERVAYWKGVGASFSETVEAIVDRVSKGVLLKDNVRTPSLSKKAKAKLEAEAKAKATETAE